MQNRRQFLNGVNSTRGKATLEFLDRKASEVKSKGLIALKLRSDKKARITESDLKIWAKEQAFELKEHNGQYLVSLPKAA